MNRGLKSTGLFLLFVLLVMTGRHLGIGHHTTATTTSTSSTTSTSTTSSTSTSTSTTSTTSTTALVACQGGDFSSRDNYGQAATGTAYDSATLKKITPGTCALEGYPLLTLQTSQGVVIPSTTVDHSASSRQFPSAAANAAPRPLTVTTGTAIRFDYTFAENGTNCATISTINVQTAVNGSSSPISLGYPASICGSVTVSAFYPDPGTA